MFIFVVDVVSEAFLVDFEFEFSTFGTSKSSFPHGRYCKNRNCMENDFKEFQYRLLMFSHALEIVFFLISQALKTILKTKRFLIKNQISRSGCCEQIRGLLGPLKT